MNIEDMKAPFTIEMLIDIADTQLLVFGDHNLIVRPHMDFIGGVEVFAGNDIVLCCMSDEEMKDDDYTLKTLLERLSHFDENDVLFYTGKEKRQFQIGFIESDEVFVEVLSSSEIDFR